MRERVSERVRERVRERENERERGGRGREERERERENDDALPSHRGLFSRNVISVKLLYAVFCLLVCLCGFLFVFVFVRWLF